MTRWLSNLTLNQRLAAGALMLGLVAIAARPYGGGSIEIDGQALASLVARGADHVGVSDLADWIVAGRSDLRIVDLRDATEYAKYHIPGAEHVSITDLDGYPLLRNETIVLYAENGVRAAQAWFLLKARGYRVVYFLDGGMDAWANGVLFPALAENPTPAERVRDDRLRAVSAFFGGTPRSGADAAAVAPAVALPSIEVPAGAAPVAAKKKKKKEGC
jgi:rhodanese-related sulfurtransferase